MDETLQVVWFKRGLRVHDNAALAHAARVGPVLPLYIVEPGLWRGADTSPRQWAFLREALIDLRDALGRLGQALVVRVGEARKVLRELHGQLGFDGLWSHQETGNGWTYRRVQVVVTLKGSTVKALKALKGSVTNAARCHSDSRLSPTPLAL